jgi:hypothetical protein
VREGVKGESPKNMSDLTPPPHSYFTLISLFSHSYQVGGASYAGKEGVTALDGKIMLSIFNKI